MEAKPTALEEVIDLPQRLGVEDLLAGGAGLEVEEPVEEGLSANRPLFRDDSLLLQRPGIFDDVARVIADQPAEVLAVGLGIARHVLVERRQGGGLPRDVLFGRLDVLVGRDGDQAEKQAVEHAEAGEDVADEVVEPRRPADEYPQKRPHDHRPGPVEADERRHHEQRRSGRRDVVVPGEVEGHGGRWHGGRWDGGRWGGRRCGNFESMVTDARPLFTPGRGSLDGVAVDGVDSQMLAVGALELLDPE